MSYIGINEYVISVAHSGADHRYFGGFEEDGMPTATCLLYTSPSPRDPKTSRMPSSA